MPFTPLGILAVMLLVPAEMADACPLDPSALLIVAAVVEEDDQVTKEVMSCVVPSVKAPIAVY